jgi:carbonic anhydrase
VQLLFRKWVDTVLQQDPQYFSRCAEAQKPEYLWIGCSDSRVVAEAATGLSVGHLFVHRNVGNVVPHADSNAMSAIEYAIRVCNLTGLQLCYFRRHEHIVRLCLLGCGT